MGIEPTTSGLDLPSLCRPSYKVVQRKSGTIYDGESRRRESKPVHMNVVPRSTGNTNSGTRELTLKCKLKCYLNPWITNWALALVKGNREPHEAKKKSFDLGGNIHMYSYFLFAAIHHHRSSPTFSVRPCSSVGRVTVDLIRTSWVRFPPRSKDFSLPRVVPCLPLLGLTPRGLSIGLSSTLIYTSELILCSTICVPSATGHNIHMYPYPI